MHKLLSITLVVALTAVLAPVSPALANPVNAEMGFLADALRETGTGTLSFLSVRKAEELKDLVLVAKVDEEWRVFPVKWKTGATMRADGGSGPMSYHSIEGRFQLADKATEYQLGFLEPDQWKVEGDKLVPLTDQAKKKKESGERPIWMTLFQPFKLPGKNDPDPKKSSAAVVALGLLALAATRLRRRRVVAA